MGEGIVLKNNMPLIRAEENLTQEELARQVGVSRQTISSIETGVFNPSTKLALLICLTLDREFDQVFYLELDGLDA